MLLLTFLVCLPLDFKLLKHLITDNSSHYASEFNMFSKLTGSFDLLYAIKNEKGK